MVAVLQSTQFKSALLHPPRRESRGGAPSLQKRPGSSFPLPGVPSRSRVPGRPRGSLCGAGSRSRQKARDELGRLRARLRPPRPARDRGPPWGLPAGCPEPPACRFEMVRSLWWRSWQTACLPVQQMQMEETRVRSPGWADPLEGAWQPAPGFLPGESHGQRSLVGYSPRVTESDMTERLRFHFHFESVILNPLTI